MAYFERFTVVVPVVLPQNSGLAASVARGAGRGMRLQKGWLAAGIGKTGGR